jgi:ATP synthase F1 delta subunit
MSQAQKMPRRDIVRTVTKRLLDEPEKQSEWLKRLAAYMVEHNMTKDVDLVVNDIAHELYEQAGLLTVEVSSARQLTEEGRRSIARLMQGQTGADKVVLHETTDQSLLGGFVARTPDAEIDASVQNKLKKLAALA